MSESLQVVCPKCHGDVPLADINVANDLALCRQCGNSFSFADALEEQRADAVDLENPPKGVWFTRTLTGFELGASTRSPAAFFLVPFMLVWSGFSLGGIYGSQIAKGHFNLPMSLFGLPFLFATIVFGTFALMTVCGKFCVRAIGNQGEVFIGVGSLGYRKRFQWDQVKSITIKTRRGSNNNLYQQIVIDADASIGIPRVSGSRADYFMAALRKLRRDFFPAAPPSAVPPRIAEVA